MGGAVAMVESSQIEMSPERHVQYHSFGFTGFPPVIELATVLEDPRCDDTRCQRNC